MAYGPGQAVPPFPDVLAGTGVHPAWLAGTADRERTVGVLRAAFTEGRLTQDELDDRVARAYASRTYADLWALTADLPAGPLPCPPGLAYPQGPYQQNPAVLYRAESPTHWHSAAALVITALVIFTLAALVTAIATAHAQPMPFPQSPFQQGTFQQGTFEQGTFEQGLFPQIQVQPFQHAQLAPFITSAGRT